jgi:hypothetical protein
VSQPVGLFDLDGPLFRWQLYHELVFELKRKNNAYTLKRSQDGNYLLATTDRF